MKFTRMGWWPMVVALAAPVTLLGADPVTVPTWHATSLLEAVVHMLLFAAVGIVAAVIGYKVFDRCTPGDLTKEIIENRNIAAAVVAGAVILGICLIVAAAMIG